MNLATTVTICKFCQSNGESEDQYGSHTLKNSSGLVVCPVLRNLVCKICRATGDFAHTLRYCPLNKDGKFSSGASLTDLKKKKNAAGNLPPAKLTWPLPSNYTKIFSPFSGMGSTVTSSSLAKPPPPARVKLTTDPLPRGRLDLDYYRNTAPPPFFRDSQQTNLSKHFQSIQYHREMQDLHQQQLTRLQEEGRVRHQPCYSRRFSASPPGSLGSASSSGSPPQHSGLMEKFEAAGNKMTQDSLGSLLEDLRAGSEAMDMF